MEMQFDKIPVTYLQKLTDQLRTQEQTLEVRLPEGMPDIGRVLGAWGQVIVRGKEWNGDSMAVACGVMVWVLYAPEDEDSVRSVEAWLPFSMKWELPETRHDGKILVSCQLKSVDARSTSARKLMVRATLGAMGQAWQPGQVQLAVPAELPEDVELLKTTYPLMLPQEAGEKAFVLEEQLELPSAGAKAEKVLYYSMQPEIVDKKVMADKVVFRGNGMLHVLYRAEDGRLYTADYDLPFSQYAELDGAYEQEPAVLVCPCVTSVDVALDENGLLQLKAGILGQYLLCERTIVSVVEDAYSPNRTVTLMQEQLQLPAILDWVSQTVHAEQTMQADAQQIVDLAFYPSYAHTERTDTGMCVPLLGQFQMLYYDASGELRSGMSPWEGQWCMNAADNCAVDMQISPVGRPQAVPGTENVQLRGEVGLDAMTTAGQGLTMVTGLALGELEKPDPNRPSLILCRKGNDRLWDVAKRSGSTAERIMQANHLEGEPDSDLILLIPVQ